MTRPGLVDSYSLRIAEDRPDTVELGLISDIHSDDKWRRDLKGEIDDEDGGKHRTAGRAYIRDERERVCIVTEMQRLGIRKFNMQSDYISPFWPSGGFGRAYIMLQN